MKLTGEDVERLRQGINALKPNRRLTLREQIGAIYAPLMKAKGRGLTNAQLGVIAESSQNRTLSSVE